MKEANGPPNRPQNAEQSGNEVRIGFTAVRLLSACHDGGCRMSSVDVWFGQTDVNMMIQNSPSSSFATSRNSFPVRPHFRGRLGLIFVRIRRGEVVAFHGRRRKRRGWLVGHRVTSSHFSSIVAAVAIFRGILLHLKERKKSAESY